VTYDECYVFADTSCEQNVLCGQIELKPSLGTFCYDEGWLSRTDAYPLDPQNLPLNPRKAICKNRNRVFPVFSDAGPDAWGTRIMLAQNNSQPKNEVERLLKTSGNGVGCLQFSLSRARPKARPVMVAPSLLDELDSAVKNIQLEAPLGLNHLKLISPGSSVGGARPKVSVHDGEHGWIVKFSRADDIVNVPRLEYASMRFLRELGIRVPDVDIKTVGGRDAFLIQRFDMPAKSKSLSHFISAHGLFNIDRTRDYSDGQNDPAGYQALARLVRKHSTLPGEDSEELFRRLLINILLGNTDDHARNHGLVVDHKARGWRLSPAYDVLPIAKDGFNQQALSVGNQGRASTIANALTAASAFGLTLSSANEIAKTMIESFGAWESSFKQYGVSDRDMNVLRGIILPRIEAGVK
jgi:serine/threonine-protein kinase HipA